mmetsp:Transcript_11779/g.19938  ORF Transcript_11779/g.19938 Transcript_11779/m.19938 type:complete len:317 (+) Transcript_11779:116-1066(+)
MHLDNSCRRVVLLLYLHLYRDHSFFLLYFFDLCWFFFVFFFFLVFVFFLVFLLFLVYFWFTYPTKALRNGLFPTLPKLFSGCTLHVGHKSLVRSPQRLNLCCIFPDANGQSSSKRSSHRSRFHHPRTDNIHVDNVRLKLHQKLVVAGTPVHFEFLESHVGIGVNRIKDFSRLVGCCLQCRTTNMSLVVRGGHSYNTGAGIGPPIGGKQPSKGRNEVKPTVGLCSGCQSLGLGCVLNHAKLITQPLNGTARVANTPLQSINDIIVANLKRHCRQQSMGTRDHVGSGVHHQEHPGPVGVLGFARTEGALPKQGSLLVS